MRCDSVNARRQGHGEEQLGNVGLETIKHVFTGAQLPQEDIDPVELFRGRIAARQQAKAFLDKVSALLELGSDPTSS